MNYSLLLIHSTVSCLIDLLILIAIRVCGRSGSGRVRSRHLLHHSCRSTARQGAALSVSNVTWSLMVVLRRNDFILGLFNAVSVAHVLLRLLTVALKISLLVTHAKTGTLLI